MTEPDPRVVEKVARAICPLIKPLMDDPGVQRSPCTCKGKWDTPYGEGMNGCYVVMEAVARKAILAMQDCPLPVVEFPRK